MKSTFICREYGNSLKASERGRGRERVKINRLRTKWDLNCEFMLHKQ